MADNYDLPFAFGAEVLNFFRGVVEEPNILEKTVDWIASQVMERFSGHRLAVWVWVPMAEKWELMAVRGLDGERYRKITGQPEYLAHLEALRAGKAPILTAFETPHSECWQPWAESEAITDAWAFPLLSNDHQVMGSLSLYWDQSPGSDPDLVVRWKNIADTMSLVIQWALLVESRAEERMAITTLLDLTGMAAAYSNPDRVVYANDAFLALWNLSRADLSLNSGDLSQKMSQLVMDGDQVMENSSGMVDRVLQFRTVPPRYVRYRARPMRSLAGKDCGRIAVYSDITENLAVRRERDAFLSLIGHEFKTPITIIDGITDWLTQHDAELSAELAANLHTIRTESSRLSRLLKEILLASQLQDADWAPRLEAVDLAGLVQLELETRQHLRPERVWHYLGPEKMMVWGHQESLTIVIQALLSNANRFSGVHFPIEITIEEGTGLVDLIVKDRGPGISPEIVSGLFANMPNPSQRSPSGGIGLGLYVARKVLDRIGGEIRYQPRERGGSVFTVTIRPVPVGG